MGTYCIDDLRKLKISKYPVSLIININHAYENKYWIALAIYDDHVYICDSLGYISPSRIFPDNLVKFLYTATYGRDLYITKRLQDKKHTCTYYCLLFVYIMSLKESYNIFLNTFSCNLSKNDKIVVKKVNNL